MSNLQSRDGAEHASQPSPRPASAQLRLVWVRSHLDAVLFALAFASLIYLGGMVTAHYRLLPYTSIVDAVHAGRDWRANWRSYLGIAPTRFLVRSEGQEEGVVLHVPGAVQPGLTLISGISRDGEVGLQLIDLDGTVRHRWPASFSSIWPDPQHVDGRRLPDNDWDTEIHGAALLGNGDVVFNFDRYGLQRLDACGEIVWQLPYMTHHSISLSDEGHLWVPGTRYHAEPVPGLPGIVPPFEEDMLLKISTEGEIRREISVLEMFYANDLESLLFANGLHTIDAGSHGDLLHLNDIEILSERDADAFPLFEAGDMMLSLRNLNLVMVINPATGAVIWTQTGPWIRQHDPDFLPDGRIMVYDNRRDESSRQVLGGSRILAIDPVTREVQTLYEGSPEVPFFSSVKGKHQMLANGNILITEAEQGRAFEVMPDGQIVWTYINRFDDEHVGKISGATRYPTNYAEFEVESCPDRDD